MNYDKLAANSLYNKISKLEIQLKNQKEQTQKANKEAENQKSENYRNLATLCISISKVPNNAPSESITS